MAIGNDHYMYVVYGEAYASVNINTKFNTLCLTQEAPL